MIRNTRVLSSRYLINRESVKQKHTMESDKGKKGKKLNAIRPQMRETAVVSTFSK